MSTEDKCLLPRTLAHIGFTLMCQALTDSGSGDNTSYRRDSTLGSKGQAGQAAGEATSVIPAKPIPKGKALTYG